jgi:uncharacterized protein YbjT (DUF2867 family)
MAQKSRERTMMNAKYSNILVIGASGYVGGMLVPELLAGGYHVSAGGRSAGKLRLKEWSRHPNARVVEANALDLASLRQALKGIDVAYYLVHSMNPQSSDFAKDDRLAAQNMVKASQECGVKRIIYLGGLGDADSPLSKHLRSRHEVSQILKSGPVPATILRAAMIIGAGSISFQILKHLVTRLPVMITPRWVRTPSQPIAIKNVIAYLIGCLEKEETTGETYDIGGTDIVSYTDLMRIYAQVAGLRKRWIIPVPILTPYISSLWIHLVTPIPSYIARPLTEGLRNRVVCKDNRIREIIPQDLLDAQEAIRMALNKEN